MKLTGKCKQDYDKWFNKNYAATYVNEEVLENALIIEFFETEKYFISIEVIENFDKTNIIGYDAHVSFYHHREIYKVNKNCLDDTVSETRSDVINKIIEKANEIYNQKNPE